jgi:hypothetical protein
VRGDARWRTVVPGSRRCTDGPRTRRFQLWQERAAAGQTRARPPAEPETSTAARNPRHGRGRLLRSHPHPVPPADPPTPACTSRPSREPDDCHCRPRPPAATRRAGTSRLPSRRLASFDVLVVGAGRAGTSRAWHLAWRGVRHLLLDAAPEGGHSWRTRCRVRLCAAAKAWRPPPRVRSRPSDDGDQPASRPR